MEYRWLFWTSIGRWLRSQSTFGDGSPLTLHWTCAGQPFSTERSIGCASTTGNPPGSWSIIISYDSIRSVMLIIIMVTVHKLVGYSVVTCDQPLANTISVAFATAGLPCPLSAVHVIKELLSDAATGSTRNDPSPPNTLRRLPGYATNLSTFLLKI